MAILGISSVLDEIFTLSGSVRPALDHRIESLVTSFEAITPENDFDETSLRRKVRTLAYDLVSLFLFSGGGMLTTGCVGPPCPSERSWSRRSRSRRMGPARVRSRVSP